MSPFNFGTLFLLLYFVAVVICTNEDLSYDLIETPTNITRNHMHSHLPVESNTKRPRNVQSRKGGSRFLARRKKKDHKKLDKSSLLGLMGDDFKEPWMTYDKPKKPMISIPADEIQNLTAIQGRWAGPELENELALLNLTADLQNFMPELLPHEALVREYLLKRTSCPVEYSWKDMGKKFWPRWVRQGECKNRGIFCSFPPGMNCVPGVSTVVYLLHWECSKGVDRQSRSTINRENDYYVEFKRPLPEALNRKGETRKKDVINHPKLETSVLYRKRVPPLPSVLHLPRKPKKRCGWKKVPLPITIDCFCAC